MSELGVEPVEEPRGGDEQPLYQRREQDERHRNSDDGVDDAEDLAALRQRVHVAIACRTRYSVHFKEGARRGDTTEKGVRERRAVLGRLGGTGKGTSVCIRLTQTKYHPQRLIYIHTWLFVYTYN